MEFQSVSIDTRTLQPGALFIALRGANFNAHQFLSEARERGAVAAVMSEGQPPSWPHLWVNNTEEALVKLACYYRDQVDIPIVAITGSCGKTTTRALLASILTQSGSLLSSKKSFNNHIGVPLTLLELNTQYDYAVLELGANHPGEIAQLTRWVKPKVAVITNIGLAHLAGFGSLAGVAAAKGEIFQGLPKEGVAVLPRGPFTAFLKRLVGSRRILTFSVDGHADCYAEAIHVNATGAPSFRLYIRQEHVPITLPLIGTHNVGNALAAAAAAHALDMPLSTIKKGLEAASPVAGRLCQSQGYKGAMIIDDSYNANPTSVLAAIEVLAQCLGDTVLVLGDMLELGEDSARHHRQVGKQARQAGISQLYCYGPSSRLTATAFGKNAYHFETHDDLLRRLKSYLHDHVTVLIKGSASMQMSRISQVLMAKE